MNKKRIIILSIILITSVLGILLWKFYIRDFTNIKSNSLSAEAVLKEHFKSLNEKNIQKLNKTMTKGHEDINWQFDNLDSVKLIEIKEDLTGTVKNGYMNNGNGKYINPFDVKVFAVKFELKLKDENIGPRTSGQYEDFFIIIKQDKNAQWLIDDWHAT